MTTVTDTSTTTKVFQVWINATPQRVWDAITDPEWNGKYGYKLAAEYDLRPGGLYCVRSTDEMKAMGVPEVFIEGEVLESDPPRRLVQMWHAFFTEETAAEPATRLTWEIEEREGATKLTVTHELDRAPVTAEIVEDGGGGGGGWSWIISDLKTMLETGSSFTD